MHIETQNSEYIKTVRMAMLMWSNVVYKRCSKQTVAQTAGTDLTCWQNDSLFVWTAIVSARQ